MIFIYKNRKFGTYKKLHTLKKHTYIQNIKKSLKSLSNFCKALNS